MGDSAPLLSPLPSAIYWYSFLFFWLFFFYIATFLCCVVHPFMSSFRKKFLCVGPDVVVFLSVWDLLLCFRLCGLTEAQNGCGSKRPLEVILSNAAPLKQGHLEPVAQDHV